MTEAVDFRFAAVVPVHAMNDVADMNADDGVGDHEIVLRLLDALDRDPNLTQRRMADDFGVALGLVNAYLKRCVKKGLVKISDVPARRYAYYLTPSGFAEKARLTRTYLSHSFTFFRNARREGGELIAESLMRGFTRIALIGDGDLAEIMVLCASDAPVVLVGVIAPGSAPGTTLVGLPVVGTYEELPEFDAALLCDLERPQQTFDDAVARFGAGRVLAPRLLHITSKPRGAS